MRLVDATLLELLSAAARALLVPANAFPDCSYVPQPFLTKKFGHLRKLRSLDEGNVRLVDHFPVGGVECRIGVECEFQEIPVGFSVE